MATVISPPEERILLHDVTWKTYEQLLANYENSSSPRFTYDQGVLEIMSPSSGHEELNDLFKLLIYILAEEWDVEVRDFGATTFRREDLARGSEPDSCFYIQNVEAIRGVAKLDLADNPPPDLVIEIDITHPSIDKFPIYAQMGISEFWLYEEQTLKIFKLEDGEYVEVDRSVALPRLSRGQISFFLNAGRTQRRPAWQRAVREWARLPE
jgi:Uma2 family endonuclease